jgi:hypothetical protein
MGPVDYPEKPSTKGFAEWMQKGWGDNDDESEKDRKRQRHPHEDSYTKELPSHVPPRKSFTDWFLSIF